MRQEKHMMDNHAKRNLRGLVASAIFAAMLGLGSGTASATPFLVDFTADPTDAATVTSFSVGGFDFLFTGGTFGHIDTGGGDGDTNHIDTLSNDQNFMTDEIFTIKLTGGGTFFFGTIYIDSIGIGPNTTVEGLNGVMTPFTTTFSSQIITVNMGGSLVLVDTVRLTSGSFEFLKFDSFTGEFVMDMQPVPEPGTLALFLTGLMGLGLLSRRRRQPLA